MDYGIFIFRRDLRIKDNISLNELQKVCNTIIPIFIFDKNQIHEHIKSDIHPNGVSRARALNFIIESLLDLDIIMNHGMNFYESSNVANTVEILINYIKLKYKTDKIIVGFNKDYTLYSLKRDTAIEKICKNNKCECISFHDIPIIYPDFYNKQFASFYEKYLPNIKKIQLFSKDFKFMKLGTIAALHIINPKKYYTIDFNSNYNSIKGGRKNALKQLKEFNKISAYLNFGCISIRECVVYAEKNLIGLEKSKFIRKLIWRDYYVALLIHVPESRSYTQHIDMVYDTKIKWRNYQESYKEWKDLINCNTGFLLVDAAMTELKNTGFVKNEYRLLLGYFSVKYLLINPLLGKIGLQYWFGEYLIDCVTSQNKLNCQWITELDFSGRRFGHKNTRSGRPYKIDNKAITEDDFKYIQEHLFICKNMSLKDAKKYAYTIFDPEERYKEWIKITHL